MTMIFFSHFVLEIILYVIHTPPYSIIKLLTVKIQINYWLADDVLNLSKVNSGSSVVI